MPLPHFTNIYVNDPPGGPGSIPQEPMYLNLFEIAFFFPAILVSQGRDKYHLLQQATNIEINTTPEISTVTQQFKFSTRAFMKTPEKTHTEFDIKFNVNVDNSGSAEVYNILRSWYDLVWNSQNGTTHYKSDIIGNIMVNQHDKKGVILRRITFFNCQIKNIKSTSLDWTSSEIYSAEAGFIADYWTDERIDGNFVLNNPIVQNY